MEINAIYGYIQVSHKQSIETKNYELEKDNFSDLRFLINDYVDHLEHHIKQIIK